MFSISDILDLALKIEQNGEKVYRNASLQASDPAISALLTGLADEEREHAQWFASLKSKNIQILENPIKAEMNSAMLGQVLGRRTFSMKEEDLFKIDDLSQIVLLSIEFEKDTALFYEMMQAFLFEEADQIQLERIIAEEKKHVRQLQEMLE